MHLGIFIFTMTASFLATASGYRIGKLALQEYFNHRDLNLNGASEYAVPHIDHTPPLKLGLLVEPTPFGYVSGYKNRFEEMLKYLKKGGDHVQIVTADRDPDALRRRE